MAGNILDDAVVSSIEDTTAHLQVPLVFVLGHWFLPDGFDSIWDLVDAVTDAYPEWEPPEARTEAAWRNAQIFAGVKVTLVDALSVRPSAVTREARLKRDLGMD